jgi:WD40 repeat protein
MRSIVYVLFLCVLAVSTAFSQLSILRPTENQTFKMLEPIVVEWTGIPLTQAVDIYISTNNGADWELKASNVSGGTYQWINTNQSQTTYLVKLYTDDLNYNVFYRSMRLIGHTNEVWYAKWSPDGSKIATAGRDGTTRIFETVEGKQICINYAHSGSNNNVNWNSKSSKVTTSGADGFIKSINTNCSNDFFAEGSTQPFTMSAWNKDDSYFAASSDDGRLYLFDPNTGSLDHFFIEHSGRINQFNWSKDGNFIVTASTDNRSVVYEAPLKSVLSELVGHTAAVNFASFSPDGKKVATASIDRSVIIWDAYTGDRLHTLNGHTAIVWYVQWSPDGSKVVSCSDDRTGKIWDANTGALLHNLVGHTQRVYNIEWSPDGSKIASASYDRTAKIWDSQTGNVLHTLIGHTNYVWTLGWSPDGHRLVTSSQDGTPRIWYLDSTSNKDTAISKPFSTEGKIDSGYVVLYPDSRSAHPSTFVEIPIILTDASNLNVAGVTAFDFDLNFNNTLLLPVGFKATVVDAENSISSIHFENIPAITGEIARVRCRVALGNAPSCRLFLTNVVPIGGPSYVQTREGVFTLLGLCEEGGSRLLNPTGRTGVVALTVQNERIELELDRAEAGTAQLSITNQIGQTVYSATLPHSEVTSSFESISTTNFSSGVYFVTFSTATTNQTIPVMIVK